MINRLARRLPIFCLCAALAGPAVARDDVDIANDLCAGATVDPATRVAACSALLLATPGSKATQAAYLVNRGNAHASLRDWAAALADYDAAIARDPANQDAVFNRGDALIELGRYAEAVAELDRAIALNRDDAAAYLRRCWALMLGGDAAAALADCESALFLEPEDAGGLGTLGFVLLRLERAEDAFARFNAAIALDPAHAAAWYGRAQAQLMAGQGALAEADLAQARFLDAALEDRYRQIGLLPD